jgi:hypothetical protein
MGVPEIQAAIPAGILADQLPMPGFGTPHPLSAYEYEPEDELRKLAAAESECCP